MVSTRNYIRVLYIFIVFLLSFFSLSLDLYRLRHLLDGFQTTVESMARPHSLASAGNGYVDGNHYYFWMCLSICVLRHSAKRFTLLRRLLAYSVVAVVSFTPCCTDCLLTVLAVHDITLPTKKKRCIDAPSLHLLRRRCKVPPQVPKQG